MYVNPFWFGVLCTILVEVVAGIIFIIYQVAKNMKE